MKIYQSVDDVMRALSLQDGACISFHHHLRNGDIITNLICDALWKKGLKNLTIMSSAIFPCHAPLVSLMEHGIIQNIVTNYINGPVADAVSQGKLQGMLTLQTHGGRPRSLRNVERVIDLAVLVVSAVDKEGNANGIDGKTKMGSLGYPVIDNEVAKHVLLVTDTVVSELTRIQLPVRMDTNVLLLDTIGDSSLIEFGTTSITKNPVNLKIARDTVDVIVNSGLFQNGFSFQTGAGGTSLAVLPLLLEKMKQHQVKGSFLSGGITSHGVQAMEQHYFDHLYDVQSFDSGVSNSILKNQNHHLMSAEEYASPGIFSIADQLDIVILGATEIDLSFNVNVVTDSNGRLIGGSGGHSDVAHGAKCTIVVSNLVKARTPIVVDQVTTIVTPGEDIDCLVTEFGIAVNPTNKTLEEALLLSGMKLTSIEDLRALAKSKVGKQTPITKMKRKIGEVEYRDGSIIDTIHMICL